MTAYATEQGALKTLESARTNYREMQALCHDMPNAEAAPLLNGTWDALVVAINAFSSAMQDCINAEGLVTDQPHVIQAPLVTKHTDQVTRKGIPQPDWCRLPTEEQTEIRCWEFDGALAKNRSGWNNCSECSAYEGNIPAHKALTAPPPAPIVRRPWFDYDYLATMLDDWEDDCDWGIVI